MALSRMWARAMLACLRASGALGCGCGGLSVACTDDADALASGRGIDGVPSGACMQATVEHHNIKYHSSSMVDLGGAADGPQRRSVWGSMACGLLES